MPCFSLRVRSSRSVHWTPQLSGWNTELCPNQWIWCRRLSFKEWIADGSTQANQIPSHILWEHGCWRRGFIEVMIRNKRTTLSAANQDLIKAVWSEWTNLVLFLQLRACQHLLGSEFTVSHLYPARDSLFFFQPLPTLKSADKVQFCTTNLWDLNSRSPLWTSSWRHCEAPLDKRSKNRRLPSSPQHGNLQSSLNSAGALVTVPAVSCSVEVLVLPLPELDIHCCSVLLGLALPPTRETVCHSAWRENGRAHKTRLNIYWKLWSNQSRKIKLLEERSR